MGQCRHRAVNFVLRDKPRFPKFVDIRLRSIKSRNPSVHYTRVPTEKRFSECYVTGGARRRDRGFSPTSRPLPRLVVELGPGIRSRAISGKQSSILDGPSPYYTIFTVPIKPPPTLYCIVYDVQRGDTRF